MQKNTQCLYTDNTERCYCIVYNIEIQNISLAFIISIITLGLAAVLNNKWNALRMHRVFLFLTETHGAFWFFFYFCSVDVQESLD